MEYFNKFIFSYKYYFYNNCKILLNVYNKDLRFLNAGILNIPGIKLIPKGVTIEVPKLINVSLIK